MSQDLFAAFGDPPQAQNAAPPDDFGDDDWGDFEDAATDGTTQTPSNALRSATYDHTPSQDALSSGFIPKAQKREDAPPPQSDLKVGKHPFAGHMDFLFAAGDDEYDAGADDLENLSTNPEAAMAYSKRIIAEQEARAAREASPIKAQDIEKSAIPTNNPRNEDSMISKVRRLTKSQPQPQVKHQPPANPPPARNKLRKKSGYAPAKDPNILFDAENVSESDEADVDDGDDDFGDFEGHTNGSATITTIKPATHTNQATSIPEIDLLGISDAPRIDSEPGRSRGSPVRTADAAPGSQKRGEANGQTSDILPQEHNPWASFEAVVPHTDSGTSHSKNLIKDAGVSHDDGGWADFEDFEASEPAAPATHPESVSSIHNDFPKPSSTASHSRSTSSVPPEPALAPTNIPPPVMLLSIFPALFSSAQEDLFGPLSKLDTTQRQHLLSHPATHQFLRSYLIQAIVLAHIIAGRKLRWKRDHILAQSMRIGPAAAGGKGGMKLTGIDKSEVAKEDREVLDVVRLWKAQLGKLRGAVTGASTAAAAAAAKLPSVPEISEQMPIKVLKAVEGGFVAPHACALCGLKREERIPKVDVDVDDSFGEWWVNGMDMHLTCKTWWAENKRKLQSR